MKEEHMHYMHFVVHFEVIAMGPRKIKVFQTFKKVCEKEINIRYPVLMEFSSEKN